jgi:hypothetical protein
MGPNKRDPVLTSAYLHMDTHDGISGLLIIGWLHFTFHCLFFFLLWPWTSFQLNTMEMYTFTGIHQIKKYDRMILYLILESSKS